MSGSGTKVLVIDDDPQVRTLVARLLAQEGYEVHLAADADEAASALKSAAPDLVLLDGTMPHTDGIDLLADIRTRSSIPVIMLTGLGDEADRILGLRAGADDYVVKPFSPGELTARIESVLRRTKPPDASDVLRFDDLEIDCTTRDVMVRNEPVVLTAKEFDLL